MSKRNVLLVTILLLLSACSSVTQVEDNPVEIYLAFEEALKGTDFQIAMSYFHDDAVLTAIGFVEDGKTFKQSEFTTLESIEAEVQEIMDDPVLKDVKVLDIYSEGDTAYFTIELNFPDGWSGTQDGYAVIKDGKILKLHYDKFVPY